MMRITWLLAALAFSACGTHNPLGSSQEPGEAMAKLVVSEGQAGDGKARERNSIPAAHETTGRVESVVPNDEFYAQYQAEYFTQVNLPQAWSITTGSPDVVIAIMDTGVDVDHPDLAENMWVNPGEIAGNGIDDDNNGFVDDINGWNFVDYMYTDGPDGWRFLGGSSDPHPKFNPGWSFDGINHGTAVAGIAASATNNSIGLAGVCWDCRIMALRAMQSDGVGSPWTLARAINYAVDNGADIINLSVFGSYSDAELAVALERAWRSNVVVVAAAGNGNDLEPPLGIDLDDFPAYPINLGQGIDEHHIIGVTSLERDNTKSSWANYGALAVDISAPGTGIAAPQLFDRAQGGDFVYKYRGGYGGTSMATPIVAGIVGLMKSANPNLSNREIMAIIRRTATNIGAGNPSYAGQLGAGLINALAVVEEAARMAGNSLAMDASTRRGG